FAIEQAVLNQPAVSIFVGAHGENNLPHSTAAPARHVAAQNPESASASSSAVDKIFSIGIRDLLINSGQLEYNDRKYPVSADLHDLQANARLDLSAHTYDGSLSYNEGRISAPHISPFSQNLQMDFAATRSELRITSLQIETGRSRVRLSGTVVDYAHPRLTATYQAAIHTADLARILDSPSIPEGEISTAGSVRYASASDTPFLSAIYAKGRLDAPQILAHVEDVSVPARDVHASYILDHGSIRVPDVKGFALEGSLKGSFSMADLATKREARLNATLRGASLGQLMRFAPSKRPQPLGLAGKTDAEVQAVWTGTFSNTVAHVRARIYGALRPDTTGKIPLNGFLDLHYDAPRDRAVFASSYLQTESAKLSFNGTLSKNSSLSIDATEQRLAEVSPLISALASSGEPSTLNSLGLRGSATFTGQVQGSPTSPRISGHLVASHVFVKSTYFGAAHADLNVGASGVSVQNALITDTMNGRLTANAHVGLRQWSFKQTSPVSLQLTASGLSVSDLARMSRVKYQFPGKLDANISVHGSLANPEGNADISVSEISPRSKNPIKKLLSLRKFLTVHLQGNGNLVHATVHLAARGGDVSAKLSYAPKTEQYSGQVSAPSLDLSKVKFASQQGMALSGTASFSATGTGTIGNPQVDAKLQIPTLQIQGQTISAIKSEFQIENGNAKFALSSTVVGGYVEGKGSVVLKGNYPATASLDVRSLPIAPLLAKYEANLPPGLQGQIELHAALHGPLKHPKEMQAQVKIPAFNISYDAVHLSLAAPMNMHYANGLIDVSRTELKGNDTELIVQGAIPVKSTRPMNFSANGSVDLGLLQALGIGIRSTGRATLHLVARGETAHPKLNGQLQIADGSFLSETVPVAVESLNGTIRITEKRLEIEQLQGTVGGGNISMTGFVLYGSDVKFNLAAQAQSVRIRYPQGIRTQMDANLNFVGSPKGSTLGGRVLVNRLSLTQQFDIATLIGQFSSQVPATAPPAFEQDVKLQIAVASSKALNLTSNKLSIGGNFNMTIAGTVANPVVLGRVALSQGEVFFMGKRYDIQSGTIEFPNPVQTEPILNVYAKTTVNQYQITLNFVGPIDRLRTNYTSTPPLSEADIIHLIAFGTTAEEAAASPSVPTGVAAESILAQGVSSQVAGRLEKLTGISQITIDPLVTDSTGSNAGSQIGIQERVSGSLLLTFSTSVTNTQAQTVEVQYSASKNVRVSLLRDYNGGYALDIRFRKTF
ncbi:MAG TPA: translocation/assembly module TamB domain-containing protein, partial [Candidatus Acidoferrales bacterium]|nr:translocation/assembly module TamB domain-containing protein [Candidatus Acidoferrales bacterium]